ncbi:anti-sigma factor RsbA family regulatory protein [Streptomyces sp. NPDC088785]|uniref:anti-sigma factor RsbA family regulatory protein n=1 Tax=Streptomyces sp. NPDC088785 TaxID=3365897 RepID=UPI003822326B
MSTSTTPRLTHQALIYGSDEAFLTAMAAFCVNGLEAEDAVLAVTTRSNISMLRQTLGDVARHVEFIDAHAFYEAPGRTMGAYYRYVDQHTTGGRHRQARVIGEPVWHGRDPLETAEWTRYEAAINVAFANCPAWIVCPYDTRTLPEAIVTGARRTHPEVITGPSTTTSHHYVAPDTGHDVWRSPLTPVPCDGEETVLHFGADLSAVRDFVTRAATTRGLPGDKAQRLVFAVNEVATNAIQHGPGEGRITLWRAGHRIVCDVTNPGAADGLDWYLGYLPPDPAQPTGHGLWTVRQLCDLTEIATGPHETTVRLHLALPPTSPR